jgi:formamidopyrimidine-DNA glycosylase
MPELPEVESARRLIQKMCVGKKVTDVIALEQGGGPRDGLFDEIVFANVPGADAVKDALMGKTIDVTNRRGKQMWWSLGRGPAMLCHFGMTGNLTVKPPHQGAVTAKYKSTKVDTSSWPPRFCKLEIAFDDGTRLAFTDPRRLGRVLFIADPEKHPPLSLLGPDALNEMMSPEDLGARLLARQVAVKALLLDQTFIAGIGNWIADEVSEAHPSWCVSAVSESRRPMH